MDQRGLGLVEVLIALGILGIVALSQSQILNHSQRSLVSVRFAGDVQTLGANIRSALTDAAHCTSALAGTTWSTGPISLSEIRIGELVLARVGSEVSPGASLLSLSIVPVAGTSPRDLGNGRTAHLSQLIFSVERPSSALGAVNLSNERQPILLRLEVQNQLISRCLDSASPLQQSESGRRQVDGYFFIDDVHLHVLGRTRGGEVTNLSSERLLPADSTFIQYDAVCTSYDHSSSGGIRLEFLDGDDRIIQTLVVCRILSNRALVNGSENVIRGTIPIPREARKQRTIIGSTGFRSLSYTGIPYR